MYSEGMFSALEAHDPTYISFGIIAVYFLASCIVGWRLYLFAFNEIYSDTTDGWFVAQMMFDAGMAGTIIGFMLMFGDAFGQIDPGNIEVMKTVIKEMAVGMSTALLTTLTGLVCGKLLQIQLRILERGIDSYEVD